MNKPVVWILKEQVQSTPSGPVPFDYTPAMKFGEVRFITEYDPPVHPNSSLREKFEVQVHKFLSEFVPHRDFVMVTGSPYAILLFGQMLGRHVRVPVRTLVWRRERQCYVEATA